MSQLGFFGGCAIVGAAVAGALLAGWPAWAIVLAGSLAAIIAGIQDT